MSKFERVSNNKVESYIYSSHNNNCHGTNSFRYHHKIA